MPIEFVQPGPETAMMAGAWREVSARERATTSAWPTRSSRPPPTHADAAVLTRNIKDFSLTPVRVETY